MVNYWDGHPEGKKELLCLFTQDEKWRRRDGEKEDPNAPTKKPWAGCKDQVEETLLAALQSTNVVLLPGTGAPFSTENGSGSNAPEM